MCNRGQNTLLRLATSRPNEFRSERSEDLRPRSGRASEEASNERRLVLTKEFSLKVYWHPETVFYGHPYITDNSYIFPKLTREIWTQVNTENGLLCPESPTFIYGQLLICRTLIIYALSPFFTINVCHNYVLIVDTVPCSNNDRFQRVNITVFLKKTVANQRENLVSSSFASV